ncbi:MAG TPA: hypothetical protein VHB79_05805 [Polyangiaceae bacterium]|nr:hypothetical protein [Polyangiaceae bacterium]
MPGHLSARERRHSLHRFFNFTADDDVGMFTNDHLLVDLAACTPPSRRP